MFYTNDEIYHKLIEEEVLRVDRGVIENRDKMDCLVYTRKNNIYYIDASFFVKYNIDKLFDEKGDFLDWDIWKCKKREAMERRENRLKEKKVVQI